jgi:two-component system, NarL family, response regulator LiaR
MRDSIRVLIVDDHVIVRAGLRFLLSTVPDIDVVGEAEDGLQAVSQYRQLAPDVVLLDLVMPNMDGVTALVEVKRIDPRAHVLVLTSFGADEKVFAAIRAGALGYLLKDTPAPELLQAIRTVHEGRASLHPTIALRVIQEFNRPQFAPTLREPLTEREFEVLRYVAQGLTNQDIASRLYLSDRTVGNHIGSILDKLHLSNRTQAALYALRGGIASLSETM